MKKTIKGFVLGLIIATLLTSTVLGAQVKKTIEVIYNSVNLTVNGTKVNADNILYNGTTYVPLRAVADALGKDVGWDQATYTASINDQSFKDTEKPKEEIKEPSVEKPKEEIKEPSVEKPKEQKVTNGIELSTYLQTNFGTLDTVIGKTKFDFRVGENERSDIAHDYSVYVDYEYDFFEGAKNSNKYTKEQKQKLKSELRDHMEEIGRAAISIMPNKKLEGGYFYSWYTYPNIKEGFNYNSYYSWKNYDDSGISWDERNDTYEKTKPSHFMWDERFDESL